MEEISFRQWGLIPIDPDPQTGLPVELRPPMFTAVTLDRGSSLVFIFRTAPDALIITLEATALTGENRSAQPFSLRTEPTGTAFRPLTARAWEPSVEGMYVSFATQVSGVQQYLKVTFEEDRPIVINRVELHRP
jgi:hypothetical protein